MRFVEGGDVVDKHLSLCLDVHLVRGVAIGVVHELWGYMRVVCDVFSARRRAVEVECA